MIGYTSKAEIENYMGVDIDESMDTQIEEWIESVEEYISKMTNRDFTPAPVAESGDDGMTDRKYDGDGTDTLLVDPFVEIDSIQFKDSDEAVDSENILTYPANKTVKNKIVLENLVFPTGKQNVTVSARFGYEEVPKDIIFVATVLVSGILNNNWTSENEIQSMTIGRYTVSYRSDKEKVDLMKVDEILRLRRQYTL